jgi:hypothetical protein
MLKLRLRSIGSFGTSTLMALAALVAAGCGSKSLSPDGGGNPGKDGGADHSAVSACQCTADTQALTVDWDCYCALHDCTQTAQQFVCQSGLGTWSNGCGLSEYTVDTAGGPEIWVFDQTGKQVGAQLATDDSVFACPNNLGLQRFILRAGQFRPDTCDGVTSCSCADAGTGPCQTR